MAGRGLRGGAPAVAADLHRAYRNYFRASTEVKAASARGDKRSCGSASPGSSRGTTSRRSGSRPNSRFRVLPDGRLSLPKIGALKVRWSRPLPADPVLGHRHPGRAPAAITPPSSSRPGGTAARGRDSGRDRPRPDHFATLSDGRKVDNPQLLRQRGAGAAPVPAQPDPQAQGQRNREKARLRVARAARPGGRRPPGLPPPALHPPDPRAPDGMRGDPERRRPRPLQAGQVVHDAGWGQFTAMLEYKAALYGRTLVKVDRLVSVVPAVLGVRAP